jgi:N-acetylglucosaminyldiphosphoundecaprenol N-acetyl-beta-D-mannosaminyltransferase
VHTGAVRVFFANPDSTSMHVVTLNPEMLMQGEQDAELGQILKNAELVIPDGAGLVWALRFNHYEVNRLPGIEFSEYLLSWIAQKSLPVGIIGAKQDVLDAAIANLTAKYPGLNVAYARNGFFNSELEREQALEDCLTIKPAVVLIAMGVPRQEKWIAANRHRFEKTVLVGVGGSLDVWSGQTKRAPGWMRAIHLEWLYRITSEPWRIQRVAKTLPMFVVKVWLDLFQSGSNLRKNNC